MIEKLKVIGAWVAIGLCFVSLFAMLYVSVYLLKILIMVAIAL